MATVNTDWWADEVATDLNDESEITQYTDKVQRQVEVKALIEGVRIDEIPLDDDGYYESRILIEYASLLYKKNLFMGYWGSSDGDTDDIYKAKLDEVKDQLRQLEKMITKESILGLTETDGTPKGKRAVVKTISMSGGAYL